MHDSMKTLDKIASDSIIYPADPHNVKISTSVKFNFSMNCLKRRCSFSSFDCVYDIRRQRRAVSFSARHQKHFFIFPPSLFVKAAKSNMKSDSTGFATSDRVSRSAKYYVSFDEPVFITTIHTNIFCQASLCLPPFA